MDERIRRFADADSHQNGPKGAAITESRGHDSIGHGFNVHARPFDFVRLHDVRHKGMYLAEVEAAYDHQRMMLVVSLASDRTLTLECPCDARNAQAVMAGKPVGLLDREGRSVLFNWPRPDATKAQTASGRDQHGRSNGRYRHPARSGETTPPPELDYLLRRNRHSNRR